MGRRRRARQAYHGRFRRSLCRGGGVFRVGRMVAEIRRTLQRRDGRKTVEQASVDEERENKRVSRPTRTSILWARRPTNHTAKLRRATPSRKLTSPKHSSTKLTRQESAGTPTSSIVVLLTGARRTRQILRERLDFRTRMVDDTSGPSEEHRDNFVPAVADT